MIGLLKPSLELVREAFCKCKCSYVLQNLCAEAQAKKAMGSITPTKTDCQDICGDRTSKKKSVNCQF